MVKAAVDLVMRLLLLLLVSVPAFTATADQLFYNGKEGVIDESPLDHILSQEVLAELLDSPFRCSVEIVCYSAQWKLSGRLYLISVKNRGGENVPLELILPDYKRPVHAAWYSGTLKIRTGERISYPGKHGSRDVEILDFIEIADGMFMRTWSEELLEDE